MGIAENMQAGLYDKETHGVCANCAAVLPHTALFEAALLSTEFAFGQQLCYACANEYGLDSQGYVAIVGGPYLTQDGTYRITTITLPDVLDGVPHYLNHSPLRRMIEQRGSVQAANAYSTGFAHQQVGDVMLAVWFTWTREKGEHADNLTVRRVERIA